MTPPKDQDLFRHVARKVSEALGTPAAFWIAVALIAAWAATGPVFHYSDTWQLVINTTTTIITFLMVFLIQNTQNRDNRSIHLKVDELIKAVQGARNSMIDLDRLSDEQLKKLEVEYNRLCEVEAEVASDQDEVKTKPAHGAATATRSKKR